MLECAINISEGRRPRVIAAIAAEAGADLLDVHTDADHHRSVLTVIGEPAARAVTEAAVAAVDVSSHVGAHPRFGAVDVVPFVALDGATLADAVAARDRFARWAAVELAVPCFLYGPERSLPEVRRSAFATLAPDIGPAAPHPTAGAVAVGARPVLVAYNVWLDDADLALARGVARELRSPNVRALGLRVGEAVQVSMNLLDPETMGPAEVYDAVAARARVRRAELVGLLPAAVLGRIARGRWGELDIDEARTIEARVARASHRPPVPVEPATPVSPFDGSSSDR